MQIFQLPSPLQKLNSSFLKSKEIDLWLKRDDLIHPEISGNKWRKLALNVQAAQHAGIKTLLTFGGAYSNHIAATAAAGKLFSMATIGIIRGDEGFENDTLRKAKENGMHLHFVSREQYKQKTEHSFLSELVLRFGQFYLIPEGGANELGVKGCQEILAEVGHGFNYLSISAGTATTASGICRCLASEKLLVFPALKGGGFMFDEIAKYCTQEQLQKVQLQPNYHFGGYGKTKPEQIEFMKSFFKEYGVELDKVYTSKMMFGLFDLIRNDYFPKGARILAIHTGGLQGN